MLGKVLTQISKGDFWVDDAGKIALYLLGFLLPLWALPVSFNPLGINKTVLAYFLILLSFLAFLIGRIKAGRVSLPVNLLSLALIAVILTWAVSGFFSISRHASFFELNDDPSGFFAVLMFVLASFSVYFLFRSSHDISVWILFFLSSAALVFLVQFFWVVFGLDIAPFTNFSQATANLIGSWSELGVFLSIAGFISLFLFEVSFFRPLKNVLLISAILFLAADIIIGNPIVLWVLFSFLLALAAYLFVSKSQIGKTIFKPSFIFALIILFFILTPRLSVFTTSFFKTETLEIRPSWQATFAAMRGALKDNFFLGSGPATFVYDWQRFRPLVVNQSQFWAINFISGAAFLPSLLAMTGAAGFLSIFLACAAFCFYAYKALSRSRKTKFEPVAVLLVFVILMFLVYAAIFNLNFSLLIFLFLFLGMFMVVLAENGLCRKREIALFQNSGSGFVSALIIIFLIIVSLSGFYVFGKKYAAAYFFGRGLKLAANSSVQESVLALKRAAVFDERDQYLRNLAEMELKHMFTLASQPDAAGRLQDILNQVLGDAKKAVELNPVDSLNWITLGQIYESLVSWKASGASDFALQAYIEAAKTNPISPEPVFFQARVKAALQRESEAAALLDKVISLKNNYAPAHLMFAQFAQRAGNLKKTIEHLEHAAASSPDDINVLFQLGQAYFSDAHFNDAKTAFERIISLRPDYANALYFLGLVYDRLGDKNAAISVFERVFSLNSGNLEVKTIISNLKSGKDALYGIAPSGEKAKEKSSSKKKAR